MCAVFSGLGIVSYWDKEESYGAETVFSFRATQVVCPVTSTKRWYVLIMKTDFPVSTFYESQLQITHRKKKANSLRVLYKLLCGYFLTRQL